MQYQQEKQPLAVIAGKEHGSGSSRDRAAKAAPGWRWWWIAEFSSAFYPTRSVRGILPLEFLQDARKTSG
ncbi:hypothetical protein M8494_08620 [Serratia ureilytica]